MSSSSPSMSSVSAASIPGSSSSLTKSRLIVDNELKWSDVLHTSVNPLFELGSKIELENLGTVPESVRIDTVDKDFSKYWQEEKDNYPKEQRSLFRVLRKTAGWPLLLSAFFLQALAAAGIFAIPLLQKSIAEHLSGQTILPERIYHLFIALILICPLIGTISGCLATVRFSFIALKIRNSLTSMIYKKCLTVRPSKDHSTGEIINLFTTDTTKIEHSMTLLANVLYSPIQIAACLALIYLEVQESMFASLAVIVALLPFLGVSFAGIGSSFGERQVFVDQRIKLTNDVLNGIRIIKFYSWSSAFETAIGKLRSDELKKLVKAGFYWASATSILAAMPALMPVLVFYTYIKTGHSLEYIKAITILQYFGILQGPLTSLPDALSFFGQSSVSIARIFKFIDAEDSTIYVSNNNSTDFNNKFDVSDTAICFENASFGWLSEEEAKDAKEPAADASKDSKTANSYEAVPTATDDAPIDTDKVKVEEPSLRSINSLVDVNLVFKKGRLYGVVGAVGSGKSTLICSLLNQLIMKKGGKVYMNGSVAYCSQQPWILNGTIEDNIVFGLEKNTNMFNKVVELACLLPDLKTLPGGIMTEIGEKGVNLSGGQKARIAFARALYRNSDIYLLDDPLSAVDAMVGSKMFNEGIMKFLLEQGKTVVLVTHQTHFLSSCEDIIAIGDGKVIGTGSYASLRKLMTFDAPKPAEEEETLAADATSVDASRARKRTLSSKAGSAKNLDDDIAEGSLIQKEERSHGRPDKSLLIWFANCGSWFYMFMIVLSIACGQAALVESQFWLKRWGKFVTHSYMTTGLPPSSNSNLDYFIKYAWLMCIDSGTAFAMVNFSIQQTMKAGKFFHNKMLHSVLDSPTAYFDSTPLGRIVNRFSSDIMMSDTEVVASLQAALQTFARLIAALVVIAIATSGTFIILIIPIGAIFYMCYVRYISATPELARLELLAKGPLMITFSETISGVQTIKAYNEIPRFFAKVNKASGNNSICSLNQKKLNMWLTVRLGMFGSLITFGLAVFQAVLHDQNKENIMSPDDMQLAITFSQTIPLLAGFCISAFAFCENSLTSLERIKEFHGLQSEDDYLRTKSSRSEGTDGDGIEKGTSDEKGVEMTESTAKTLPVPEDWPVEGRIEFDNVVMGYREGPDVLKGVVFSLSPREKIGVVGRTGSGKSTVMQALFRMERYRKGRVLIDGLDLTTLSLHDLRSRLCIIPQDPIMFATTIRENLDPFNLYKDEDIWNVLDKTKLRGTIERLANKLSEAVTEGGSNFSVGQRQLICFARALLRKPRILVLDEATASVDNETDTHIQLMIREMFKDCTVLTIAHRLQTIIDSDRIMVLRNGVVAEMDTPTNLLANPDGLFTSMWKQHSTNTTH